MKAAPPRVVLGLLALGLAAAASASCASAVVLRPAEAQVVPSSVGGSVWEPGHQDHRGHWIPGFWRHSVKPGFAWVSPHVTADGAAYVRGGWRPLAPAPAGHVWTPGHRGSDGHWVDGFWRLAQRPGYAWIDGHYGLGSSWIHGHWEPTDVRVGHTWVPGHPGEDGYWVLGHWRETSRRGFIWVDGYWADGEWYWGHWVPLRERQGFVWVPGYPHDRTWVVGYWRPQIRHGYVWVPGHWRGTTWAPGRWHVGAWFWTADLRVARYAHYHPVYGHGYAHHHARVRRYKYVPRSYAGVTTTLPAGPSVAAPPRREAPGPAVQPPPGERAPERPDVRDEARRPKRNKKNAKERQRQERRPEGDERPPPEER